MGRVVLRDHESAAGFLVETMNNAGTFFSSDAGQILAMGEERIHERVLLMPRAGMHDDSRRFVENEEIVVFENYVEFYLLRLRFDFLDLGFAQLHSVAGAHGIARAGGFTIEQDEAIADQRLESGSGKGGKRLGEKTVQALSRLFRWNDELDHG